MSVLTAANLSAGLGEEQNNWRTEMAGANSDGDVLGRETMADAASYTTCHRRNYEEGRGRGTDHFTLMSQTRIDELEECTVRPAITLSCIHPFAHSY